MPRKSWFDWSHAKGFVIRIEPPIVKPEKYARVILECRDIEPKRMMLRGFGKATPEGIGRARLFRGAFLGAYEFLEVNHSPENRQAVKTVFGEILGEKGVKRVEELVDLLSNKT